MSLSILEIDGTAEDVQRRLGDFAGQRLHVTIQSVGKPDGLKESAKGEIEGSPTTSLRPIGLCKGQFVVPDSFFDPLPPELLKAFEGDG